MQSRLHAFRSTFTRSSRLISQSRTIHSPQIVHASDPILAWILWPCCHAVVDWVCYVSFAMSRSSSRTSLPSRLLTSS
jgi:hypothetical protein